MIDLRQYQLRNHWFNEQGIKDFPFFKDESNFANFVRKNKDALLNRGAICRTSFGVLVHPEKIVLAVSEIVQETTKGRKNND
jgi:hypothetical protein